MKMQIVWVLLLPVLLTGCGLVPFPHTLKMPSEEEFIVRDKNTGLRIDQATIYYTIYKWENWIKPLEYDSEVLDDCTNSDNNSFLNNADVWKASNQGDGVFSFSQKTKIGWSKFWGIGPLGSWLYDTYGGYYVICSPGYHGLLFSDGLHSGVIHLNEYITFEDNKVLVNLVPITEDIEIGYIDQEVTEEGNTL